MKNINKQDLKQYASGLISKEDFLKIFKSEIDFNSFDMLLEKSLNDFSEFNMLLWYLPTTLNDIQKDKIFKKYLSLKEGHQEHEELLNYFHKNFINADQNVIILQSLVENPPRYFQEADRENVFKEKCIFTIAKQPTMKAKEALIKYIKSTDETIARASELYLQKII